MTRVVHGFVEVILMSGNNMLYAYETAYGFAMLILMCAVDTVTGQKYLAVAEMVAAFPLFIGALTVDDMVPIFLYLIDGILSWIFASYLSSIETTTLSFGIPEAQYVGLIDDETIDQNIRTVEEVEI